MTLPTLPPPDMVHVDAQGYSTPCYTSESMQQYALASLRAQPESVCPECHCHFTGSLPFDYEVTAPGSTRLVNTAQPNHIVDASEMVDHSELIAKLRDHKAGLSIHRNELMQAAADALEGKTK